MDMGEGKVKGLSPAYIRQRGRGVAAAAARPTASTCTRRTHDDADAAGGDAGRLRRADQGRQGARHRRLELQRAAPRRSAGDEPRARPAALRDPAAALQPVRPRGLRGRARAALRRTTASASSTTTRWPAAFSPASTAARPTRQEPARRRRARSTSMRAACASSARSTRWPPASAPRPAQVAMAWLMARPGITAPIASATSLAQLDELVGAARLRPRHALHRADRSRQPGRCRHERRHAGQEPVDDPGAALRRRHRHPVDGHPPRLRPVAAADHDGARLDPRDLRLRAGRAEPRLGHRRAASPARWPTASAPFAC